MFYRLRQCSIKICLVEQVFLVGLFSIWCINTFLSNQIFSLLKCAELLKIVFAFTHYWQVLCPVNFSTNGWRFSISLIFSVKTGPFATGCWLKIHSFLNLFAVLWESRHNGFTPNFPIVFRRWISLFPNINLSTWHWQPLMPHISIWLSFWFSANECKLRPLEFHFIRIKFPSYGPSIVQFSNFRLPLQGGSRRSCRRLAFLPEFNGGWFHR